MSLLRLDQVTVRFGGLTAVDSVDLAVEPDRVFSVIGPNGAGKTTVFNVVTGVYEPTSGAIAFQGRGFEQPFSLRAGITCAAVGLLTALAALCAFVNVDLWWKASVKRNFQNTRDAFSYAQAWRDACGYLRGELWLEPLRGNRWEVRTPDGIRTLAAADSRAAAEALRERYAAAVAAPDNTNISFREDRFVLTGPDGETLAENAAEAPLRMHLESLRLAANQATGMRRAVWLSLALGLGLGAAGSYAVWRRARRTPDVINRAGVARTFQNIRLFQNMTVQDNVLAAMSRRFTCGVFRMAFRSPKLRREEAAAAAQAGKLLEFVGLAPRAHMLARNLPYGDQRRLEIARALATEPRLLLLDEPAAGMNPAESADLTKLIERIRQRGVAVLLIEHHMRVVMGISDRVAVLDYGKKIAEGTPDEVRANPLVIKAYLGDEEVG